MSGIRIGCAGWHYPDWVGAFYSPGLPGTDWLGAYAAVFPSVEVDSTFYALPDTRTVHSWIEKVKGHPEFSFAPKVHRDVTHEHLLRGEIDAAVEKARAFVERVAAPLEAAGRLAPVLLQLPPRFDAFGSPGRKDPVRGVTRVLEALEPDRRRVAVEFRHASWYDHVGELLAPEAAEVLRGLGVACAKIDGLGSQMTVTRTAPWSYFRFHGRRTEIPLHERGLSHAPYDYLYSPKEISELAAAVRAAASQDKSTIVIFNNHYRGQSARNALELMDALALPRPSVHVNTSRDRRLDDFLSA